MKYTRKGWAGTWFIVVAFSFVALLITMGGWAGAVDEGAVHDTPGVESVHDTATGEGHEIASHGEEGAAGHGEGHGAVSYTHLRAHET